MISFLEYSAGGKRGGELFTGRLHAFLKKTFIDIIPPEYQLRPELLHNPIRAVFASLKRVRHERPRLVVVDVSSGVRNLLAVRYAQRRGAKLLVIVQDQRMNYRFGNLFLVKWLVHRAERHLMRSADLCLVNSRFMAAFARRWAPDVPIVVSNPGFSVSGANDAVEYPDSDNSILHLLCAGQPSVRKGTKYLLEAMSLIKSYDIKLHLTGEYSPKDRYCRMLVGLIRRLDLKDNVLFHGYLPKPDLESLYRKSHLFVISSLSEGYGIALAEALAHGLPVVATRVAAIPEMIEDGVNGILVPPRDPHALAEAIQKLITDRALWRRIHENNLAKAKILPTWDDFNLTLERELIPAIEKSTGLRPQIT
jgi:glycosyltransferase involved in cell wall biosynthesis